MDEKALRRLTAGWPGVSAEVKWEVDLVFMVDGKMCVTVKEDRIMCRIHPDAHDEAVARAGCEPMVMRGKELRGYVRVSERALRSPAAFDRWMRLAIEYNPHAPRRGG